MRYIWKLSYQISILIAFSFIGNLLTTQLGLTLPGSIIGIILLFLCLHLKLIPVQHVTDGADFLLANLLLLFIPSVVGIIQYQDILSANGIQLVVIIIIGTAIVMITTGLFADWILTFKMEHVKRSILKWS